MAAEAAAPPPQRPLRDQDDNSPSRGVGITPADLAAQWRALGLQDVVEFYGHSAGPYRSFSNFFEQRPFVFEVPKAMCQSCPRLTPDDRQVMCTFSEKAIMVCKAAIMGDAKSFKEIASATKPGKAKSLGRKVANWDEALWQRMVCSVAFQVVYQKFSKTQELQEVLLQTGDRIVAEATTNDCNWGIGLNVGDPRVQTPSQWRGTNILGWALIQARTAIRDDLLAAKGTTCTLKRPLPCELASDELVAPLAVTSLGSRRADDATAAGTQGKAPKQ